MTNKTRLRHLIKSPDETIISVVIPAYKVTRHILDVINSIGPEVSSIFVVDDACPDNSGLFVEKECHDPRVRVLFHEKNQGVGGAVMTGYRAAINDQSDIIVKIDGDGQMDPALLPCFVSPLINQEADYTKGNRFFTPVATKGMPSRRVFGNVVLSFITKVSTGYWNIFDPTNGYTAIQANVCSRILELNGISKRYFFESDTLGLLGILNAKVVDIPMDASYNDEVSNLHIHKIIGEFILGHLKICMRRILYQYYINDLKIGSFFLPLSLMLIPFGCWYLWYQWSISTNSGIFTSPGKILIGALPLTMGLQLFLAFLSEDISKVPSSPITKRLTRAKSLS